MPANRDHNIQSAAAAANQAPTSRPGKNCAECRRLKVKCDRKTCIRRGCADWCPGESYPIKELFSERQKLTERVKELEDIVKSLQSRPPPRAVATPHSTDSRNDHVEPTPGLSPWTATSDTPAGLDGLGLLGAASARAQAVEAAARGGSTEQSAPGLSGPDGRHITMAPSLHLGSDGEPVGMTIDDGNSVKNSGTLVVSGGRSRYLGGSAMPLWLSERGQDASETRPPSPSRFGGESSLFAHQVNRSTSSLAGPPSALLTYALACNELPNKDEGLILVESNYRHLAWNGSALSREEFLNIYESVYDNIDAGVEPRGFTETCLAFQRIACVYIVLSLGTLVSFELPLDDPTGKHYFDMARQCLVNGRFLTLTTLIGVMTTSLMARFCSYAGIRSGWDLAWQMRGLAMRLVLSMGLHRDGQSWDLSPEDLNNRRKVFWEAFSHDVFLSRCWDRPTGIAANQYDTRFPDDFFLSSSNYFELHRCKLAVLVKGALDESLQIKPSPYNHVVEIWQNIVKAESEVPFNLRCRATSRAMVSRFTTQEAADAATPEPSRKDLRLTFQQHSLTLDYCAAVFLLLRPYFAHALYNYPVDPTRSMYADAYLAVIERSSMMIAMLRSIHSLFPLLSTRHWQFWSHAFSSAVCMATVCIVSPRSPLVPLAMAELESVITLLQSILTSLPHRELRKNLDWLLRLRQRAKLKSEEVSRDSASGPSPEDDPRMSKDEDVQLIILGWRTRLIELGETRPPAPESAFVIPPDLTPPARHFAESDDPLGHHLAPDRDAQTLMGQGLNAFGMRGAWSNMISSSSRQPVDSGRGLDNGGMDQASLSPDFLQQLLGAPVSQPFPIDVFPETNTDDFNQMVFDLQNFLG